MPERKRQIHPLFAIKTWRYLRLAMVVLVIGLGASIAYERLQVHPGCFQASISAYYYTPVRACFVAALIGVAVCLVCQRGNTCVEDILLTIAGVFATVVAIVPTPNEGGCTSAHVIAVNATTAAKLHAAAVATKTAEISNNVTALLAAGAFALVIVAFVAVLARLTRAAAIAALAVGVVWLVALLVFELDCHYFEQKAHNAAAFLMFACIIAVVVLNATGYGRQTGKQATRNPYIAIAVAMGLAVAATVVAYLQKSHHWAIWGETAVISLFAVFWTVETKHLWNRGLWVAKDPTEEVPC